ncbi:hypothetical protein GCM10017608_31330 [Agromyces luteolus]|uniref:Uncharacterized protein n=1 Tax=Agromyces luteolus TaxID=88373 RepID=A0A7C9HIH6_9MICO|nr:hypothetical protein [Agromyces luteolus]MUN07846.1 hypothetical protein [Agromyces luteolus]GLK29197.1 hypothetical protein GCM10017608_31330 [Agromyces luteolus]
MSTEKLPNHPTAKGPEAWFTGDVSPAGEWHWHGASAEQFMCHLALWEAPDPESGEPETEWGELLTAEEYPG